MLNLPLDYHISIDHGEKQKIVDRASEAVWQVWDHIILRIIPQWLVIISLIIGGIYISPTMTLISMIIFPFTLIGIWKLWKIAHKNQKEANKLWDKYFWSISDTFSNLKIIRIFTREDTTIRILQEKFSPAREAQHEVRKNWVIFYGFWWIITALAQAITVSSGIILFHHDSITLGTLLFFIAFTDRVYGPLFNIFENIQQIIINLTGYETMLKLSLWDKEIDNWKNILPWVHTNITFENVSFSYPSNDREVLSDISLTINKGERIALVGHTGSGKSTIIQLLMRFYEPSSGSIKIDGTNIYDSTLESYRSKFAAVFQDTTLFNETIRHNLEYVRDGLTLEDLQSACQKANILDFIESLPERWETEVGERGLKLSWGEKQRIAIARAILTNPEILILDEATSALDTKTERLVQEAFDHLMEWRTSIIIAHRLSTIMNADRIYILEKGRIIDSGTHTELYQSSILYREMVDLQHDGFVGEDDGAEATIK